MLKCSGCVCKGVVGIIVGVVWMGSDMGIGVVCIVIEIGGVC